MEDDTVKVSPHLRGAASRRAAGRAMSLPAPRADGRRIAGRRCRGRGLLLAVAVLLSARALAAPTAVPRAALPGRAGLSPLPPLQSKPADSRPPAGLPPLPLLASAEDVEPTPYATPKPGSVVEEDEEETASAKKEHQKTKAKKPECENDAQCPVKTICASGVCKSPQRMVSALVYYHQPGPIGFRLILPFYYSFWRPERTTRTLFPLFVDRHDRQEGTRNVWVFPNYQYYRAPGERSHRLWPLFFYSNYGDKGGAVGLLPLFWASRKAANRLVVVPPLLLWHQEDGEQKRKDTLFLPALFYLRQQPQETLALFLLLGYYHRTKEETNAGLIPLLFYSRNQTRSKTVVLPLFYRSADHETGEHYTTLLPLFFHHRDGDRSDLLLTPLGGSYKDLKAAETTTVLLLPPLVHRDDPARRITVVPPLLVWVRNKQNGHAFGFTGPFFYSKDDDGVTNGIFPIYLRVWNRTAAASTHVLFPVAALHLSPRLRFGFLGPLYGWSREGAGGGGLLPLLSIAHGPRPHALVLPPLFIYAADRDRGSTHVSVGPLFVRTRTKAPDAGFDAGLFPLLFISRHGARSTQVLVPLFYHHKEPYHERVVLGPFYYDRRCPRSSDDTAAAVQAGLFPLLFWKRSREHSYTVVVPLLWHVSTPQRAALVVGPLFWHKEMLADGDARTTTGLLPLFYWQHARDSSLLIGPLFGYRRTAERRTLVIGPYIETVGAPGTPEQTINRAILPLIFFHCSAGRRALAVFPLFLQVREGTTTTRSLAFLYFGVQRPEGNSHVLFPLLWYLRGKDSTTFVLGPLFAYRNPARHALAFGLLPLLGYGRDEHRTVLASPLGFYYRDHDHERTRSTVLLLFYADLQSGRADYGLFPLFFVTRRGTASALFVPPFFYDSRDPARDRSLTILGPLYFGHRGAATYGGFLPLVFGHNEGNGSYRFTVLPLFHFVHHAGSLPDNSLYTALFGFSVSPGGYRFYLGPLYVRRDDDQQTQALLPLFYDGRNRRTDVRTTFLLPLFFRSHSPEASLTAVTPLVWHYRNLTRRVTFVFPLALDVHDLYSERLTAVGPVLPLFIRQRNYVADTTTWVFPPLLGYVKRRADGHHDAVLFPLLWYYGGEQRSTTVLFPLLYYLKRPATRTAVLLPLFIYHRDEQDTRTLILPPLLTYSRRYASGRRDAVLFPLLWYSHDEESGHLVLFPLLWHFRSPNYTATVVLPFGARWHTDRGHYTLVFNVYYYKGDGSYTGAWSFHLWPLFSVGRPRRYDVEWTILGGLVGYSRAGINRTLRLLWGLFIPLEPVGARTAWYGATWRMSSE